MEELICLLLAVGSLFFIYTSKLYICKCIRSIVYRILRYSKARCNLNYSRKAMNTISKQIKIARERKSKKKLVNLEEIYRLPDELISNIIEFLTINETVKSISVVNLRLRNLVMRNDFLWRRHLAQLSDPTLHELNKLKLGTSYSNLEASRWYELLRKLRDKHASSKKKLLSTNVPSLMASISKRKKLANKRMDLIYTTGNDLMFQGIYTDGGCDEDSSRFWADNLFSLGQQTNFCSKITAPVNCFGVYSASEELKSQRNQEIRRRKALLWNFQGLRLHQAVLESVDNFELETLFLQLIDTNIDEMVKVKCKIWERKMYRERRKEMRMINIKSAVKFILSKAGCLNERYVRFHSIYNSFSRTKTQDVVDYCKRYINLKGTFRTILFSVRLLFRTLVKYVHYVNHSERLKRVLEISQRKVRYKNALYVMRSKILAERETMQEEIILEEDFKEGRNGLVGLDDQKRQVIDPVVLRRVKEISGNLPLNLSLMNSMIISRRGGFTSPLSVGCIFVSASPFSMDMTRSKYVREMENVKGFMQLQTKSTLGLLPPILTEYRFRSLHVIEFVPRTDEEMMQPVIWFNFDSTIRVGLSRRMRPDMLLANINATQDEFVYKLERSRLAQTVNVQLIAAKPAISTNVDASSTTFYGQSLSFVQ